MKRSLTPEDVLSFQLVDDAQISPDGSCVAFVRGDSFKSDSKWPKSTIWTVDTVEGELRQLTAGPRTDAQPRWSPDGQKLAFLSDRLKDGQRQVFLISLNGGEAVPLTDIQGAIPTPRGLNALQWSPDGRCLAFLREDPGTDAERRRREALDDAVEFERNPKFVRVWVIDVATKELRCVSPEALQIWEFGWSPDSQEIAAVASDVPYEWAWYTNRLVKFRCGGPATTIWQSKRQVALPVWSPDAKQIAFISSNWSDRNCVAGDVWVVSADGGEARDISTGLVASLGWMQWSADSRELLAIGHDRGGVGIHRLSANGTECERIWWRQAAVAEAHWPRFSRSANGNLAVVLEDADNPRDVWLASDPAQPASWKQLTKLHPQAADIQIGQTSVHHWQGSDGRQMQGLLITPVGHEPGKRIPLVMWVHGGPTGVSASRYYAAFGWNQLLANAGYAVFLPNYRGSVGWGLEFAECNIADMGGHDFEDMLLGIDSLIATGLANPDRLAIAGWSYGGFTAAWAVSQTSRFRASVMGAGISHWLSFHGRSALADWDAIHYGTSPYEPNGLFQKFSPVTYYENLQTPTLILHGEEDQDVPVEQAYLFHRTLKDKRVPTELVVYPREDHAVKERLHLVDMSRRVLEWMQRYLT
ncbi:MAG TPA: S9 family peptidase [Planctomycetaceae bacterium]